MAQVAAADEYWNSAEPGCDGSNPDYLFCDDFEDGSWIQTCGAGPSNSCCTNDPVCVINGTGLNNPNNDGWIGDSFVDPTGQAWTACGGQGFGGTSCTSKTIINGNESGGTNGRCDPTCPDLGNGENGRHLFSPNGATTRDLYVRFYLKLVPGYRYGYQKLMAFEDKSQSYRPLILKINGSACNFGISEKETPSNLGQNQGNNICLDVGNWYYIEMHAKLDSNGADGVVELWADNCGANGDLCTEERIGSGTLRMRHTGLNLKGASKSLATLWVEEWGNPGADGETYRDQYIASRSRIGPMGGTFVSTNPPPAPPPAAPEPTPTAPAPPVLLSSNAGSVTPGGGTSSGGSTPSEPVDITVSVAGRSATVDINATTGPGPYHFNVDCDQDGNWDGVANGNQSSFAFTCPFSSPGTKNIRVLSWIEGDSEYDQIVSVSLD